MAEHPRPKGRVYLYVSGGKGGENVFTNGTFEDMRAEGISPEVGMRIACCADDGNEKGEPDHLLFSAVIGKNEEGWFAIVDWDTIMHESDLAGRAG